MIVGLVALSLVAGKAAFAQLEDVSPSASGMQPGYSAQELPIGDGDAPPVDLVPQPPEPASAAQIEAWRKDLIGKPAFSSSGGRVGTVTELSVGLDERIIAATITTDSGARLPVIWYRVRAQLGKPTLVVPWSQAEIIWLTRGR